jgi:hypothetical protein
MDHPGGRARRRRSAYNTPVPILRIKAGSRETNMKGIDGRRIFLAAAAFLLSLASSSPAANPSPATDDPAVAEQLTVIARAGPLGSGSTEARAARDALARRGLEILPQLFVAMDTRNVVAANWVRTVFDEIVSREAERGGARWPRSFLEQYAADSRRAGRPRRLALAMVERCEPGFTAGWIPGRLGDPEFGYEAVAHALSTGEKALREKDTEQAKREFRKAFDFARDAVQVAQAATRLKALDITVDPVKHLGLVTDWRIVGPFDAPEKSGFARVFEPEQRVDLAATYPGKEGKPIGWIRHQATDKLGQVNLIDALGTTREAVAYAYAEIEVPQGQAAELRCGADDNCTVWLNSRKIFGRDQWLNGTRFDRFSMPITLSAGRNTLLVKVCQGPQHRDPEVPNNWSLQLRLCDDQGRGIEFQTLSPESAARSPQ